MNYDILIIGGGVNGCGIARDAAGRGYSVLLAEMGDLGQGTSSASTKLFHGGLRYLEYYEFRLVREALKEREILLRNMPHISWPMRFVLPVNKGQRPAWLVRLGLFLYDHLGGRKLLPKTATLDLSSHPAGRVLKEGFAKAFEYSDCWVQDARLVSLNARDAAERGADIRVQTRVTSAVRDGDLWRVTLLHNGAEEIVTARTLINAAGPWVKNVIDAIHIPSTESVRLVRGSHIVTRKLYNHNQPYFFQNADGRIGFLIPFEDDFTLIGTTDFDHDGDPATAVCTDAEKDYLLEFANGYLKVPVTRDDIVWTYSGVRSLYDDGASSATEATRDYVLSLDENGPPLLNIFGGKITTYRRLAEGALAKLSAHLGGSDPWTEDAPLPGGNFAVGGNAGLRAVIQTKYPWVGTKWVNRLIKTYGTDVRFLLEGATCEDDLGQQFGATLTEREVRWLITHEFARTADDILWRRTKLGLRVTDAQAIALQDWMDAL